MALQRHNFAKGYISHTGRKFIRVEESYDGESIEISVGDDELEEDMDLCTYDCDCNDGLRGESTISVDLSREQIKELMFVIKQLHFIDEEKK